MSFRAERTSAGWIVLRLEESVCFCALFVGEARVSEVEG